MGQAFFSLSITGSGMIVYGAYLEKSADIPKASLRTALFDTLAALLSGLAIMPAVFAFGIFAGRNLTLTRKIAHVTCRSTREKLLSFLSSCAQDSGSAVFSIPFDRQQLADYLAVERSAMSAELSRMKKDGLLDYHKNHFRLFTK